MPPDRRRQLRRQGWRVLICALATLLVACLGVERGVQPTAEPQPGPSADPTLRALFDQAGTAAAARRSPQPTFSPQPPVRDTVQIRQSTQGRLDGINVGVVSVSTTESASGPVTSAVIAVAGSIRNVVKGSEVRVDSQHRWKVEGIYDDGPPDEPGGSQSYVSFAPL